MVKLTYAYLQGFFSIDAKACTEWKKCLIFLLLGRRTDLEKEEEVRDSRTSFEF